MTDDVSFAQILGDLSSKDNVDRDFLHNIILNIPRVSEVVDSLFSTITTTSNEVRKIDIFNLLIAYLQSHQLDDSYDDAKICKLIENIALFPIIIKNRETYANLNTVLQTLIGKLSSGAKDTFVQVIPTVKAPYAPFVFSAFSVTETLHLNQIFLNVSTSNIPLVEGVRLVLSSHKKSDLQEEDQQLIKTTIIDNFIPSLLGAFNDVTKSYGVSYLTGLLNYDTESAEAALPSFDNLHSLLRKNSFELRTVVLELFASLTPNEENINSFSAALRIACTLVKDAEDPLIPHIVKYAASIKSQEFFVEFLNALLVADATVVGAFFVALELDCVNAEVLEIAFPAQTQPNRTMISISLIKRLLSHEKCTDAIFCALLNQAINAYASADILKKVELKEAVLATIPLFAGVYSKFGASFSLTLLNRVTEITNLEVFEGLAKAGASLEETKAANVEDEALFRAFSYVFSVITPIAQVQNVVTLFATVSSHEEPKNPFELVSNCIPAQKLNEYITYAESSLKQIPRLAVLCVSVTGLDEAKLDELLKFVQQDDVYTLSLGVQFFYAMNIHYFNYFMNTIEKEAYGKQVTGNIFVARKKRIRIADTVRAIITVLPHALEDKELSKDQQKQLIDILYNTIPHANIEDFADLLKGLRPVFALIKDVDPNEDQYTFFIDSGFIREIPYLLRAVKGTPELNQLYTTIYADNIKLFHYEPENIEAVAATLFRLSPTEDSLFYAMELVRKRIKPKDTALKFAAYAKCFAAAAAASDVHITTPRFAPFLVKFIIYTTCKQPEFRQAAFAAFASLFDVPDASTDVGEGLTREQVNEQALTLFSLIAPKLSPEFINEFLQVIHKKRFYTTSTGLFIRALFEVRDDLGLIDVYGVAVMRLLKIQPQMPPLNRFHMEKGILSFAKRSMATFLPLFLSSDSPYLATLVGRILASGEHRQLFIQELTKLINTTQHVESSLILFDNLKRVVTSERTNELTVESFASLTVEVLMWTATIYQLEPTLNLIQINQAHSDMAEVFSLITSKTTAAARAAVSFTTTEPLTLNQTIAAIAKNLVEIDIERLVALLGELNNMLTSPKQTFILAAGFFLIQFAAVYTEFTNKQTQEFITNLYASICKAFQAANVITRRCLAVSLNRALGTDLLGKFTDEDATAIYNLVLESIESQETQVFDQETIHALCNLSSFCNNTKRHPRRLLNIIRKGLDTYEVNPAYFVGLASYLEVKTDLEVFTAQDVQQSKASLQGFFQLIATSQDETLKVLQKLTDSEDVVSGLQGKVEDSQLANCASLLLGLYQQVSAISPVVYNLLCAVALALEAATDDASKRFKNNFVLLSLPAAEDKASPFNEKAIEAIKHLVH
ncbi:hypothetical protein TRFO_33973 [Tritrichomonas foetus]|uniref:Uncharacterized protein n=1 Tax=Tritrichomonas foetus TaxID=1144522 RepID=A0A1J4JKA6_9EUKA|nr:hypothetical protein TRFO_33973 [Tritrichomonas foetus]|eukprot:OHS99558.1 hypothetical protein TRFO_33973 [Tritrichomonas foetus]